MINQKQKVVFIDKDGTLIPDIPYNVNVDLIEIETTTIEGLKELKKQGFLFIVVSNQSGLAKGYFSEEDLKKVNERISGLLWQHRLTIDGFYYCPHHPEAVIKKYAVECDCRKPLPGLIYKAAKDFDIDLLQSWMIGDILNDVEAGKRAGCRTILLDNGNETEWIMNEWRTPDLTASNIYEAASLIKASSKKAVLHERMGRL
jgi:D-glycero-D-manno-heptose 1,7-bisphosphate phosphatase